MSIGPEQSRAARGLISWTQQQLAEAAGVGLSTLRDFENAFRNPFPENVVAIRKALETAGVIFIDEEGTQGPGVRLRKRQNRK
jgi:transcriptional regulator with XRE-family HTH domain